MNILKTSQKRLVAANKRVLSTLVIAGLLVASAAAAITLLQRQSQMQINTSGYQVVSLVSGQVYFGHLKNTTGEYLYLASPYIEQTIQPQEKNEDGSAKASQTALVRVKDQVYGPEDTIAIKSSQVSFWQNLRDDSKVTQAIKAKSN